MNSETTQQIVFVDDDIKTCELIQRFSEDTDYDCITFQNPHHALEYINANKVDLIITDLRMPGMTGIELLEDVRNQDSNVPVILITGYSTVDSAVEALRLGATDFIKKPFDMEELFVVIDKTLQHTQMARENKLLRRQLNDERGRYHMIGSGPEMQKVYSVIEKIADIRCNVLIEGESGSGKELAARAIHYQGEFAETPFIVIDCGALTDTLLESELFGHEKGAFTGAVQTKQGLLETASGGTVFLDEICNISDAMQVKMLRVIQEQQVLRVGGVQPIDIDVRFVVATNRSLEKMLAAGEFREDLFHRLNVIKIEMPPLRKRRDEIPLLINHFVEKFAAQFKRQVKGFDGESMQKLCDYDWPGNVRELSNLVERHVALADVPVLTLDDGFHQSADKSLEADMPSLEELIRRYTLSALEKYQGNREKTAAVLGINKSTLWRRLQQYKNDSAS